MAYVGNRRTRFLAIVSVSVIGLVIVVFLIHPLRLENQSQRKEKETSLAILRRDQGFPLSPVNEIYGKAFVVDDFIIKEIPLGSNYFSIAAISALYEDAKGKEQRLIIPIAVRNSENNLLQVNGKYPRGFDELFYDGGEGAWSAQTGIRKGWIIFVTLMMPSDELANNSTWGFGFETAKDPATARYTQQDLERFYRTGDPEIFPDNILWPLVHIFVDSSLNDVDPNEPVTAPLP